MAKAVQGLGVAPYQGYEYQILATVYVALDLMLSRQVAERITVEAASGEDIAATLEKVDPENASSVLKLKVAAQEIQVQIKLRRSDQWTPAGFRNVLCKTTGDTAATTSDTKGRIWPLEYLQNTPEAAFVLITDAQINSDLKPFSIKELGDASGATKLPDKCTGEDALAPRIGILAQLGEDLLYARIKDTLTAVAHVPSRHVAKCIKTLKESVRQRLLGQRASDLPREELVETIRANHGFPDDSIVARHVEPLNFSRLSAQLADKNRLLIAGTPGSGKSLVARRLLYDLSLDDFDVVTVDVSRPEVSMTFLMILIRPFSISMTRGVIIALNSTPPLGSKSYPSF